MSFICPAVSEHGRIMLCQRLDISVWDHIQLFSQGDQLLIIMEDGILILQLLSGVHLHMIAVDRNPRLCAVLTGKSRVLRVIPLPLRTLVFPGMYLYVRQGVGRG